MNNSKKIFIAILAVIVLFLIYNEIRITNDPARLVPDVEADIPYSLYRLQIWIAAAGVLAVYSFVFKENPFFRLFEHALLGCATGYGCAIVTKQQIVEKWFIPIKTAFAQWASNGFSAEVAGGVFLIIPGIIGLLWYFQFSKKYFWISRIAMCIGLGAGAGLAFKDSFNQLIPQITGTFKSLWPGNYIVRDITNWQRAALGFENLIFVLGTASVLIYFFFAFSRKHLHVRVPAKLGRWYLMVTLGAFFGNTFMTRLSALIERVHFLVAEWLQLVQM